MSSKTSKLMNKKNIDMKRKLTKEEIEDIVSVIKPSIAIPKDIATGICEKLRKKCYLQLEHVEIYPSLIPELKENILKQYYKTLIQPGESVGVATAQSIGERQTQQTLNTFHTAGSAIKTVVTGVPRFSELLNATREPKAKSCQIFL